MPTSKIATLILKVLGRQIKIQILFHQEIKPEKGDFIEESRVNIKMFERDEPSIISCIYT